MLNARVEIFKASPLARVLRVYPDEPLTLYAPGQYGSLGLLSPSGSGKILKRPYSISNSILDLSTSKLIDRQTKGFYEFYFNRLPESIANRESLTPLLFELKDGDRIFCGSKIVGYYTLKGISNDKNILLLGSTTGESPNNAIINQALEEGWKGSLCQINVGPPGWSSLYMKEQEAAQSLFPSYKYKRIEEPGFEECEVLIRNCLADSDYSRDTLGFNLRAESVHVFICGDPVFIGAPVKLGAWKYEMPEHGILRVLTEKGFTVRTKFQEGNVEFETYW